MPASVCTVGIMSKLVARGAISNTMPVTALFAGNRSAVIVTWLGVGWVYVGALIDGASAHQHHESVSSAHRTNQRPRKAWECCCAGVHVSRDIPRVTKDTVVPGVPTPVVLLSAYERWTYRSAGSRPETASDMVILETPVADAGLAANVANGVGAKTRMQ